MLRILALIMPENCENSRKTGPCAVHLRLPARDIFRYEMTGVIGGLVPIDHGFPPAARVRSDGGEEERDDQDEQRACQPSEGRPEEGGRPEGRRTKSAAPKQAAAPKKKAAPVKLTPNQTDLLKKVHGAGEAGLPADSKAVAKSLEALKDKKLIKKGKKNKDTGHVHYHLSKAGEKHLSTPTNPTT